MIYYFCQLILLKTTYTVTSLILLAWKLRINTFRRKLIAIVLFSTFGRWIIAWILLWVCAWGLVTCFHKWIACNAFVKFKHSERSLQSWLVYRKHLLVPLSVLLVFKSYHSRHVVRLCSQENWCFHRILRQVSHNKHTFKVGWDQSTTTYKPLFIP